MTPSLPHAPVAAHAVDPSDCKDLTAQTHQRHDVRGLFNT